MRNVSAAILVAVLLGGSVGAGVSAQETSGDQSPEARAATPWPSTKLKGARAITSGHDRFVVVGGRKRPRVATSWISTDGVTWTRAPDAPALGGASMHTVVSTDDGFVALGIDPKQRVVAWHSPDGLAWERGVVQQPRSKGLDAGIQDVVAGPAGLLAYANFFGQDFAGNRIWRSEDGRTWKPVPLPRTDAWPFGGLAATADGYLLMNGDSPAYWRSDDGLAWTPVEDAPWFADAAASADGTIVGIGVADIWATTDLATWEQVWVSPTADDGEQGPLWVTWDGERFASTSIVGYEECLDGEGLCPIVPLLTSDDGYTWTESTGPDGVPGPDRETSIHDIASLGDTTVAIGRAADGRMLAWLVDPPAGRATGVNDETPEPTY